MNSHCAGTTKMWYIMKSREKATEEISLQATSEYSQRRCGRYMMWKTVPNTSCGDWKQPIADGRQACASVWSKLISCSLWERQGPLM